MFSFFKRKNRYQENDIVKIYEEEDVFYKAKLIRKINIRTWLVVSINYGLEILPEKLFYKQ